MRLIILAVANELSTALPGRLLAIAQSDECAGPLLAGYLSDSSSGTRLGLLLSTIALLVAALITLLFGDADAGRGAASARAMTKQPDEFRGVTRERGCKSRKALTSHCKKNSSLSREITFR